ncbi:MAG: NACHT domain-containing protein [Crocosphaera sp.]|nr:NACHT domain-containing protein [Crocosphaera sp.]
MFKEIVTLLNKFNRFKYRQLALFLTLALISCILLGTVTPVLNQNPTTKPSLNRQELVEEIKNKAKFHVDNNLDKKTDLIVKEYSSNSVVLSELDIAETYEAEYNKLNQEKKKQNKNSPKEWFKELITWITGIGFLGFLIRDWVRANNYIDKGFKWFYNSFSGWQFLRKIAIGKYKKALVNKYEKLYISFRQNRPLEMREIYVPLKVKEKKEQSEQSLIEAEKALEDYYKLMVIGSPGSGKSVLLKYLTLSYAERGLNQFSTPIIPVLLELSTVNLSDLTVESLTNKLVEFFYENDFPNANNCVEISLKTGRLLLLFDGLDEVIDDSRSEVIKRLKAFLNKYKECPFIITCRTAVYNNELYDTVNKTLEINDFNDQQIRRFLNSFKYQMPPNKSVEQLLKTLDDRPKIKTLAKNPLLLTIIAYLYTDTTVILPYSRGEFYKKAIDILSEARDEAKNVPNNYTGIQKRRVLQGLALYVQTRSNSSQESQQNRRIISDIETREQVKKMLDKLNIKLEEVDKIIDEIVKRSGLLLRLDGGQRYQFAHQTLEEYFVAAALTEKSDDLVNYWKNAPNDWREIMKLWCGLPNNSTDLIKQVYEEDKLMAFECLGDTIEVEPELAKEIIEYFKDKLGDEDNEQILNALGSVAASSSSRGQEVFEFLSKTFKENLSLDYRKAAVEALVKTNKPEAVISLLNYYHDLDLQQTIKQGLVDLGNLSIPSLIDLAKASNQLHLILEDIKNIGTPEAAIALVPFLWDSKLENRTAWHLGSLIQLPEIEEALNQQEKLISQEQKKAAYLDWIWHPFDTSNSNVSIIAGRIAYLLVNQLDNKTVHLESFFQPKIDPRLMIPICAIAGFKGVNLPQKISSDATALLEQSALTEDIQEKILQEVGKIITEDINLECLNFLLNLPCPLQLDLLHRLIEFPQGLTINNWRNLYEEVEYQFFQSRHYRVIFIVAVLLSLGAIVESIVICSNILNNTTFSIFSMLILAGIIIILPIIVTFLIIVSKEFRSMEDSLALPLLMSLGFFGVWTFLKEITKFLQKELVWEGITSLYNTLTDEKTFDIAFNIALAGAFAGGFAVAGAFAGVGAFAFGGGFAVAGTFAFAVAGGVAVAGVGAFAVAGGVAVAGVGAFAVAGTFAGALPGSERVAVVGGFAVAGAFAGAVGYGLGVWYEGTEQELGIIRYLSILAFPWFCWFPIVFSLVSFALLDTLSIGWPLTCLFWLITLGLCSYWWKTGQRLEAKARNPFKGILDKHLKTNQYQR